jgi:hypothetical protein
MGTPTDDRRDLLTVIAHLRAKPGTEQDLNDALDAHLQTPHLLEFAGRLDELLDDNGLTITRLRRLA